MGMFLWVINQNCGRLVFVHLVAIQRLRFHKYTMSCMNNHSSCRPEHVGLLIVMQVGRHKKLLSENS